MTDVYRLDNGTRDTNHLVVLVDLAQAYILGTDHLAVLTSITLIFILGTDHSVALTGITLIFIFSTDHSVALTINMPTYPILYPLSRITWLKFHKF